MSTSIPAARLAKLHRAMSMDNIANNSRMAVYQHSDAAYLRDRGLTAARIPIECCLMEAGIPTGWVPTISTQDTVDLAVARLDQAIAMYAELGILVILCPFANPNIYTLGVSARNSIISRTLIFLTSRYKHMYTPDQLMFELINEPRMTIADYQASIPVLYHIARNHATHHTLVIPSAGLDLIDNLSYIPSVIRADPNIVATIHQYQPGAVTQGTTPNVIFPAPEGTPGSTGLWTLSKLRTLIKKASDWTIASGIPLWIGEFGVADNPNHPENRAAGLAWLQAMMDNANEFKLPIGIWSFDGGQFGVHLHDGGWRDYYLDIFLPRI